jgi:hypothetical protein
MLGLIPLALGFALVVMAKLDGPAFMGYCQTSIPALVGISLGGSALVKVFSKPEQPPSP